MDSFSGSCPQNFIHLCLDLSSEKDLPESTPLQAAESNEQEME